MVLTTFTVMHHVPQNNVNGYLLQWLVLPCWETRGRAALPAGTPLLPQNLFQEPPEMKSYGFVMTGLQQQEEPAEVTVPLYLRPAPLPQATLMNWRESSGVQLVEPPLLEVLKTQLAKVI